jgi:hypothetical protein
MPVIFVEGVTDRTAVEAVAAKLGVVLPREGVEVVPIGGAQAIRRALRPYEGERVAGLCDVGEERWFRRVLGDATHVCDKDLEDELIRALGAERVEEVIAAQGELEIFRNFQNQLFWRERPVESQLRRWLQNGGRQHRYPPFLIEAMEREEIPRPLASVLAAVA